MNLSNINTIGATNITFQNVTFNILGSNTFQAQVSVWSSALAGLACFGIFVNALLFIAAWPKSGQKSSFGLLICHFLALHIAICLVTFPNYIALGRTKTDGLWDPSISCRIVRPIFTVLEVAINWSDAIMAGNRVIALFWPLRYAKFTTKLINIFTIFFCWIAGLIAQFLPIVGIQAAIRGSALKDCTYSLGAAGIIGQFCLFFAYFIPYGVSGVGALLIVVKSCKMAYGKSALRAAGGQPSRAFQHRLKMANMLLLTFLWTALCATPGNVTNYFDEGVRNNPMMFWWFRLPRVLQYTFTPCIMLMYNTEYGKRLGQIIGLNRQLDLLYRALSNTVGTSHKSQTHSLSHTDSKTGHPPEVAKNSLAEHAI